MVSRKDRSEEPAKVVVVGRRALARRFGKAVDGIDGFSLHSTGSRLHEVLPTALEEPPRILLLEPEPPEKSDLSAALLSLGRELPDTAVVIVCDPADDRSLPALAAGASGVLDCRCDEDELARALRAVSEGGVPLPPEVGRRVAETLRATTVAERPSSTPSLSPREQQYLEAVSAGMRNGEAAKALGVSVNTVRAYMKSISLKLGTTTRAQAVAVAIRDGLL